MDAYSVVNLRILLPGADKSARAPCERRQTTTHNGACENPEDDARLSPLGPFELDRATETPAVRVSALYGSSRSAS